MNPIRRRSSLTAACKRFGRATGSGALPSSRRGRAVTLAAGPRTLAEDKGMAPSTVKIWQGISKNRLPKHPWRDDSEDRLPA